MRMWKRPVVEIGDVLIERSENEVSLFLVEKSGTIYDCVANVGPGFEGTIMSRSSWGPISLDYKIGRGYLKEQLREGNMEVIGHFAVLNEGREAVRAWASSDETNHLKVVAV